MFPCAVTIAYPFGSSRGLRTCIQACKQPLVDWIIATGVGLVGHEMRDNEAERVERNDGLATRAIPLRLGG
jgi:hypothetical protein